MVGNNKRVYFGSTVNSCFFYVDADGNGDGTIDLLWSIRMENKTEELVPAIYKGKVYILNSGGYLHAIEWKIYGSYIIYLKNAHYLRDIGRTVDVKILPPLHFRNSQTLRFRKQ